MSSSLETRHLQVGYEKTAVVDDVTLEVKAGEVLTLIGANGSGKSTILKSITGQLAPLGGAVYLDGRESTHLKEHEIARSLSMVMTDRIHPEYMTCRDVVSTGRYPYTGRLGILQQADWDEVDRAIHLVHADDVAGRNFMKVSDGQRQRIMLARAICQSTPVLLLDEPTSYLDMKYKLDILTSIRKMARERHTAVIMSLHELDLAQKVSDRIACVGGGRIRKVGTPEEIFRGSFLQELFDIDEKSFNTKLGTMYLPAGTGKPQIFVIAGGGSAVDLFYRLQRENIPFAAGILGDNDIDCAVAQSCAVQTVVRRGFFPAEEAQIERARQLIDLCRAVICTAEEFGPYNEENRRLREYAAAQGKLKSETQAIQEVLHEC